MKIFTGWMGRSAWDLEKDTGLSWEQQGCCAPHNNYPARWWDLNDGAATAQRNKENKLAIALCGLCPVLAPCLRGAVKDGAIGVIRAGKRWPLRKRDRVSSQRANGGEIDVQPPRA